ncbi:hypothetical protein VOLCADRAFT_105082 [Volvox carteri f. nagariensis]|uniref:Uncharacterized protein n=1 Tax=Volvox carteri f. nagariensis TaxID=3068 RepID=D8TYB2_VOLCA|nr:uncharacterized protein VOLCADRAFT_105082 [Volvox carteri f. nagariensis]EFJ47522.1 hypothetical protein VOLCADRAFT_105082 [Volvox carteri f. nagariensis]|eukprot:XP_002951346.1 hypothetical protein VOLCADRAFT_105082 [Volvox carteri f. nagariensis]
MQLIFNRSTVTKPAEFAAGSTTPSGRTRLPYHLSLDPECLAAAVAFAEEYPGNTYGRAILMQFVSRQVSRALLRSPRCGLRGLARSAEALTEVLYGSGGGEAVAVTAAAATADYPEGSLGPYPSVSAQSLLLLDDEDGGGEAGEGEEEMECGGGGGGGGGSGDGGGDRSGDEADGVAGAESAEGRALRAAGVTCHAVGSALSATRQMQPFRSPSIRG